MKITEVNNRQIVLFKELKTYDFFYSEGTLYQKRDYGTSNRLSDFEIVNFDNDDKVALVNIVEIKFVII